jgi:hypothetical protein
MVEYELLDLGVDINKLHIIQIKFIYMFDNELLSCNTTDKSLDYLTKHPEEIEWELLSSNENKKAIELLIKNPDKIDWYILSNNNKAIELLIKNPEKINSKHLSINQFIIIKKVI